MTTVIKNSGEGESSSVGLILGVLLAIILIVLFFIYAVPALRNTAPADGVDLNVDMPSPNIDVTPDINPTPNPVTP